jgi:hypothetical protein
VLIGELHRLWSSTQQARSTGLGQASGGSNAIVESRTSSRSTALGRLQGVHLKADCIAAITLGASSCTRLVNAPQVQALDVDQRQMWAVSHPCQGSVSVSNSHRTHAADQMSEAL